MFKIPVGVVEYWLIVKLLFFLGVVYLEIDWLLLSLVAGENGGVGIYAEPFNADTARRLISYVSLLLLIPVGGIILLFDDVLPFDILDELRIAVELF